MLALVFRGAERDVETSNDRQRNSLIIYAATIGELSGAKAFIEHLTCGFPDDRLVLLCGQCTYLEATKQLYPNAFVGLMPDALTLSEFLSRARPRMLCILEGPSLHGRFPIRMDWALVAASSVSSFPVFVVDACLHPVHLHGLIDRLEHHFFGSVLRQGITAWYPPFEAFADELRNEGVPRSRVLMAGEIKFSNVLESDLPTPSKRLSEILEYFSYLSAPIIAAGSVTGLDEIDAVLAGWACVKAKYPAARLILAPRQVQRPEIMAAIYELLGKRSYSWIRRTAIEEQAAAPSADILVVDVFGELQYLYAVSSVCYIGRNHGVLEPMRFEKPVVTAPKEYWEPNYVTYQQFKLMLDAGGICSLEAINDLGCTFLRLIEDDDYRQTFVDGAKRTCAEQQGAVHRIMAHMRSCIKVAAAAGGKTSQMR